MDQHLIHELIALAKKKRFNGHILIIEKNQSYELCLGIENHEKNRLITKNSMFPIASGTKFLTALAIGQLIDSKKLSLDTKVNEVLDLDRYPYDKDVQIKHLLSHTSGLPDYLDESLNQVLDIDNQNLVNVSDYLKYFPKEKMESIPGSSFKYHNGAYVYLALIIETIAKMSYEKYINERLLKPLKINHSGVFFTSQDQPNKVMGYIDLDKKQTHVGHIPEMAGGDGGAYMNAYDFHNLLQAFTHNNILSESLTQAFCTPQIAVDDQNKLYYGYGLWLKKSDKQYIPYLVGVDAGISFKSVFYPKEDCFYWMVTNTSEPMDDLIEIFDQLAFILSSH
jgi:CubicO group peptidase (beta-lactamase class C family)